MGNTLNQNTIRNLLFKTLPIASIFYLALTNIIPRNTNNFLPDPIIEHTKSPSLLRKEQNKQTKYRHKISQDLNYHQIQKNWYRKTISKITLNKEGKIIGYKLNHIFYPNYFTKTQLKNIIPKSDKFPFSKTNLHIVKIHFTK